MTSRSLVPEAPGDARYVEKIAALRRIVGTTEARLALVIILFAGVMAMLSDAFLTTDNLRSVSQSFAFIGIAGLGQLLIVICGGIDLSPGSTMGMAGLLTASLMADHGASMATAIALGLVVGAAVGGFNAFLHVRFGITPFIVTLASLEIVRGIAVGFKRGQAVSGLPNAFKAIGNGTFLGVPIVVVIMIALAIATGIVLQRTSFGRDLYAIGGNRTAASYSGVPVARRLVVVYIAGGVFPAIAGILVTARLGAAVPNAGWGAELVVIAAVVVGGASLSGGKGSATGVLLGAALLGLVNNALVLLTVPTYWQQTFIGAVIAAAALVDRLRRKRNRASAT